MVNGSYKWTFDGKENTTFRICVSDRPSPMAPHWHEEIELMYFYKADGIAYRCRGNQILLTDGDLLLVNPRELHECTDWGKGTALACVMVNGAKMLFPTMWGTRYRNVIKGNEQIRRIFEKLQELVCVKECCVEFKECMISSLLYELFAHLSELSDAAEEELSGVREEEIRNVLGYIVEKNGQKISVDELAGLMNLSTDRFYHVFKEYTGVSPTEYMMAERIARACSLLAETERSITQIAQECGFCTSSYFCQRFLKHMGMTPRAYRTNRQQMEMVMINR